MSALNPEAIVILVTALIVGIVIVFHYEVIQLLNHWHGRRHGQGQGRSTNAHRPTVLVTMFVLLFAHITEIYLFGVGYWVLLLQNNQGALSGYPVITFLDCVYFSAANYSTVGWGDLAASGNIRFLAGTEALVGLMMITWSASYSYLVMARAWGDDGK